jgi:signal transduction histidine kinase
VSDLGLEAIKALDLESYFDALLREWYDGVVQRGDGAALVADLRARGLEVDALVAEVERLRTLVRRTGRTLDKALAEVERLSRSRRPPSRAADR